MTAHTTRDREAAVARAGVSPARVLAAVLVCASAGAATVVGQEALPADLQRLANSTGSWTLVVFASVWFSRALPFDAVVLGAVGFLTLNLGYALAQSVIRGDGYALSAGNFWVVAGFLAGPLVGLGASWVGHRRDVLAGLGVAGMTGVLVGDGWTGLTVHPGRSGLYWGASIAVGLAMVAVSMVRLQGAPAWAVAVLGTGAIAAGFVVAMTAGATGGLF